MIAEKVRSMFPVVAKFMSKRPAYQKALTPLMILHSVSAPAVAQPQNRTLTTKALSRGIELVTTTKGITTVPGRPLQLAVGSQSAEEKPLCVLLCWLMSKKKHVMKYAKFYLDQGFSCLTVQINPWQLLWPVTGSQVIAKDILTFLTSNTNYHDTILHGFSVGGYLWGEAMNIMREDPEAYATFIKSVRGQLWDSVVDMEGIPHGLSNAVFPNNKFMKTSLEKYITYHMGAFEDVATKHYRVASQCYHDNLIKAPAQFLCSLDDSVGSVQGIRTVASKWEANGLDVSIKAWDSSPHVSHLHHHPKEYKQEMKAFLGKVHLLPYPEKFVIGTVSSMA